MDYKFAEVIGRAFGIALRQGKKVNLELVKELDTVYEKAQTLDKVTKLYEKKEEMYSNEFVEELGYILNKYEGDKNND